MTIGPWLCDGGTSHTKRGANRAVTSEHNQMTDGIATLSRFFYAANYYRSRQFSCTYPYTSHHITYHILRPGPALTKKFNRKRKCSRSERSLSRNCHVLVCTCFAICTVECVSICKIKTNKNLAIANRSRVSCAYNTSRASIGLITPNGLYTW